MYSLEQEEEPQGIDSFAYLFIKKIRLQEDL